MQEIIQVGQGTAQTELVTTTVCTTPKRAAKRILALTDPDTTVLIVGLPKFVGAVKEAVTDALIGLS